MINLLDMNAFDAAANLCAQELGVLEEDEIFVFKQSLAEFLSYYLSGVVEVNPIVDPNALENSIQKIILHGSLSHIDNSTTDYINSVMTLFIEKYLGFTTKDKWRF